MGVFKKSSESRTSTGRLRIRGAGGGTSLAPGDPDPRRFKVLNVVEHGPYLIAEIQYPDATNYQGRKLAVYRVPMPTLLGTRELDPHFNETVTAFTPLARFPPTPAGWELARVVARHLQRQERRRINK